MSKCSSVELCGYTKNRDRDGAPKLTSCNCHNLPKVSKWILESVLNPLGHILLILFQNSAHV